MNRRAVAATGGGDTGLGIPPSIQVVGLRLRLLVFFGLLSVVATVGGLS